MIQAGAAIPVNNQDPHAPARIVRESYRAGFQAGWLIGVQDSARLGDLIVEASERLEQLRAEGREVEDAAGRLHAFIILRQLHERHG
ncbi:MAG TPA: hypothetical protein VM241_06140 [Candidatus Thermoplasmatota archaeon]|nr:hypothetical protein [Candidatus Thermoplasmatota archaeon]